MYKNTHELNMYKYKGVKIKQPMTSSEYESQLSILYPNRVTKVLTHRGILEL